MIPITTTSTSKSAAELKWPIPELFPLHISHQPLNIFADNFSGSGIMLSCLHAM
jgi:hypothetical protein